MIYPLGKLPADHLGRLLKSYQPTDDRLIMGGQIGADAAVLDMGDRYLVTKTDPITFATDQIGWYAVNICANDIFCTGATPKWFLATILLPENKTTPKMVDDIFQQLTSACENLGVSLIGGHTEITYGLDRPLVIGQMLGEVDKGKLVLTSGAKPGDDVVLTKHIAIEAIAIMAAEKRVDLLADYDTATIDNWANFLHEPGISVAPEAKIGGDVGGIHAMHDPTEGGIATGLHELAQAAQVGLKIFDSALPHHPVCVTLCQKFGLDPLGVIASGSLLMAVDPISTPTLLKHLAQQNIHATIIGQVLAPDFGVQLCSADGQIRSLPNFKSDEITKLF